MRAFELWAVPTISKHYSNTYHSVDNNICVRSGYRANKYVQRKTENTVKQNEHSRGINFCLLF